MSEVTNQTDLASPPSLQESRKGVAHSAGVVGVAVMVSRLFGLVREQVFATFFGAGYAMDAFIIAFRIPNLLRDLFAEGALSAAFVTTFSRKITQEGEAAAWRLANLVNNGLVLILTVIVGAGILFAPQVVNLLIDPSTSSNGVATGELTYSLAVRLTRIMFPFLIMVSLATVAMGVLNAKDTYGIPASASTMFNVGSIIGGVGCAWYLAPHYVEAVIRGEARSADEAGAAIVGMAIGTLLGGMLQWLVQVPSLQQVGYRWKPIFSLRDEGVRQMMRLMAPAIIASAALQINVFVNTRFASGLGEGPVSWLSYAFRLIYLPIGIFGVAISTATLPVASRAAALDNLLEFRRTIASSLRLTFFLTIPSAVGLIVLSEPIIALIFERGLFDADDTRQTAIALCLNAVGLTAYSAVRVLVPSFFALKETRTPMLVSLVSIVINYLVAWFTVDVWRIGHRGLAFSISVVSIVNFLLLLLALRHRLGGIEGGRLLSTFWRVMLASTVMGGICFLVSRGLGQWIGHADLLSRLVLVGGSIGSGLLVFVGVARLLRLQEMTTLSNGVSRWLQRRT
jgi:putative peptidoglycan lipid II flippase